MKEIRLDKSELKACIEDIFDAAEAYGEPMLATACHLILDTLAKRGIRVVEDKP